MQGSRSSIGLYEEGAQTFLGVLVSLGDFVYMSPLWIFICLGQENESYNQSMCLTQSTNLENAASDPFELKI